LCGTCWCNLGYASQLGNGREYLAIDYRCDHERKNTLELIEATSWYHCVADHVIDPLQALLHPQTQKKNYPPWIVNPQPQLPGIHLFAGKQIWRLGIVDFNLPSNWWVCLLQKPEFWVKPETSINGGASSETLILCSAGDSRISKRYFDLNFILGEH
jgi:hypothetical protein